MRQAFLVIVLVGAAFGGGAVVSGPGFRWAQEHLLDYMGLKDGGEIDSLDMPPPPGESPAVAASSEPLVGEAALAASRSAAAKPVEPERPAPSPPPTPTEPFQETKASEPPASAEAQPTPTPAPAQPSPLLGALSSVLSPAAKEPAEPPPTAPPPADPGVEPASLPALEPPPGGAAAPEPVATLGAGSSSGKDWSDLRRKLASAGVARYTIEGEPDGRVIFACLIPLAGRQAVTQRFEAEGADEFQAAQTVLKRINLWRASQGAAASP